MTEASDFQCSKNGQGAFSLTVRRDGTALVNGGEFASAQAAYDFYRPMAGDGNHVAWNICYHLEDVLGAGS